MSLLPVFPRWKVNGEYVIFISGKKSIPSDRIVSYNGVDGNPVKVKLHDEPFRETVHDSGAAMFRYDEI